MVPVRRERTRLAPAPRGSRGTLHAFGSAAHVAAWALTVAGRAPSRVREEHGAGQRLAAGGVLAPFGGLLGRVYSRSALRSPFQNALSLSHHLALSGCR